MRAAKHKRVDVIGNQGLEITQDQLVGHVILKQAFLDQRDEQWTCTTTYAHIVISCAQRLFVRPAANRCPGPDHADMAVATGLQRGARSRLNHSDHRHGKFRHQHRQRDG